ncbi:MAG TPA: 50S ribosomal protein L22 [Syntrophales bacterium]|nr:50S ribosomal protein L22 [Syntrophales bacterium]HOM06772.1 50S ribosomal protein L22 [Syntrophales bacterium]HON99533.1 50S ribosomal protein L22 [Syntrophales bacterium]HPC00732.1 50S ribosomal protein L22 [Syntrophales bacterium]HPQ06070.1 50S ribosomal protein L22 [Syntrophales bacterium]
MEARAVAKYIRVSPQKARLVVDLIRGKKIEEATRILTFTRKYSAALVGKVLKSALANARQNPNIDEKILYVKEIYVDQGPSLKRWRARAQGRAAAIKKRMSHITVVLDELYESRR